MKDRRDEILDELLARLDAGESIEECLAGYPPAAAEDLRASLQVVLALRALRQVPPPRPEARRRIRAEVLARAAEPPAKRGGPAWSFPVARRWAFWTVGAMVVLVLLMAGIWQYGLRWRTYPAFAPGPASTQLAGLVSTPTLTPTPAPTLPSPTPPASESPTPPPAPSPTPRATRTPARGTAVPVVPTPSPTPSPAAVTPAPTTPAPTPTPVILPTATWTPTPPPPPTPTPPPPPPPTSPPAPTPTATEPPPTPTPAQTAEPGPTFVSTLVPASEPTATPVR
ncbi:MAG: hypothetical protein H5T60_02115 [Anaerolineae bacterium]|nr:hypothetical protein [Anaerolineae bacterium]